MHPFRRISLLTPSRVQRALFHLLFWLVLFVVRLYLTLITFNVYGGFPVESSLMLTLISTILIAAVYYLFSGPVWVLLAGRRFTRAIIFIAATVIAYTSLDAVFERLLIQNCSSCLVILNHNQPAYYHLLQSGFINIMLKRLLSLGTPFSLLLTLSIPLSLKLALNGWRNQVRALQLSKQNIELEFNFLKAQINPHFLFNTMNNIYGLILKNDNGRSADLMARLSGLLRYMLYETNESHAPLQKELKLLSDYFELEKIRLNETTVTIDIRTDANDYEWPPLLLMPLLENAFKFGSDDAGAYIHLFLDVHQGKLRLTLDNTVDIQRLRNTDGGIGLANFRKRLDLYYPERYWYESGFQDGVYSVNLSIDL
ncbi:MAG TPA: histidine kinase [Mucilaginibacter sp.]|nr:histidine kinase [Mucilaginibacter sp.]